MQTNEMARSCTAEQKPEPKNLILLLLCNANLENPPKTVKFLSAPLTRHPSRHMHSCFPGRPPPLTFPQKPSCPDDLRNANIPQKLANGRCGSVHVFRREKGAPSTEVRGTGLVVERLHGGGWSRSGRKSSRNGGNVFSIRSICCCIPLEIPWGRATPCLSVPHTLRDHTMGQLSKKYWPEGCDTHPKSTTKCLLEHSTD